MNKVRFAIWLGIFIDGIPESANEDLVEKVKDIMRIDMKFTHIHRLKNRRKTNVKFHY